MPFQDEFTSRVYPVPGLAHRMSATAANAYKITETNNLLDGKEKEMWGDAGYQGIYTPQKNRGLELDWHVAMRSGKMRGLGPEGEQVVAERLKAHVRARVKHPFLRVKRVFGYGKMRYRGLPKNTQLLTLLLGLGNLLMKESQLANIWQSDCVRSASPISLRSQEKAPDPQQTPDVDRGSRSRCAATRQLGGYKGLTIDPNPSIAA